MTGKKLSECVLVINNGDTPMAIVTDGEKETTLTPAGTEMLLKDERSLSDCQCRPVINDVMGLCLVAGEDDCPVHGFGEGEAE